MLWVSIWEYQYLPRSILVFPGRHHILLPNLLYTKEHFWMSNIILPYDMMRATVKTIDRSTFWSVAPTCASHVLCQKCERLRKAVEAIFKQLKPCSRAVWTWFLLENPQDGPRFVCMTLCGKTLLLGMSILPMLLLTSSPSDSDVP